MALSYSRLGSAILGFSLLFSRRARLMRERNRLPPSQQISAHVQHYECRLRDPMNKPLEWKAGRADATSLSARGHGAARFVGRGQTEIEVGVGFPGVARSVAQPTVFGGLGVVGSQNGRLYSLNAKTGCGYWDVDVGTGVHSAVVIGPRGDGWTAYFGDQGANVHAVDALTGKSLWTAKIDDHPAAMITGSPTLVGTTLFVPVSSSSVFRGAQSIVSLLHLSRQRRRLGPRIRKNTVEDVHDRGGSQAQRGQCGWFSIDGAFGSGNLVVSDF